MVPAPFGQQRLATFVTRSISISVEQYQKLVSSTFEGTVIKLSTYEIDLNNLFLAASLKVFIGHKVKQMPKVWPL